MHRTLRSEPCEATPAASPAPHPRSKERTVFLWACVFNSRAAKCTLNGTYGVVIRTDDGSQSGRLVVKRSWRTPRKRPTSRSSLAILLLRIALKPCRGARADRPGPCRGAHHPCAWPHRRKLCRRRRCAKRRAGAQDCDRRRRHGLRSGGTVLNCHVRVGDEVEGDAVELSGVHINGTLDVSPWDLQRLKLVRLSVTAPAVPRTRSSSMRLACAFRAAQPPRAGWCSRTAGCAKARRAW